MSSSSRTSSSFRVPQYVSKESRAGIDADLTEIEEPEDLDEWPRDQVEKVGDVIEDIEDAGVCCLSAISIAQSQ